MKRLASLLAFGVVASAADAIDPKTLDGADNIAEVASTLWQRQEYAELEKIESYLLKTNPKTKSGYSALFQFNHAIQRQAEISSDDPRVQADLESRATAWAKRSPGSPIAQLSVAYAYLGHAWQIRGNGYANTVTKAQWEGFRLYSNKARDHLLASRAVAQKDPSWHQLLIRIGLSQSTIDDQEVRRLAKDGLGKYPDYTGIIIAAIDFYSPKWGGSAAAMESFAERSIANLPTAQQEIQYGQIYNYIFQEHAANARDTQVNCKRWVDGNIRFSGSYPTNYNLNWVAYSATRCGNRDVARRYFKLVEPEIPPYVNGADARADFVNSRKWAIGE